MKISAVLVTRGDHDLWPVMDSLPFDDVVVWDNSKRPRDIKVFGRYAGIDEAVNELIYVQDDDCVLDRSSIEALVRVANAQVMVAEAMKAPAAVRANVLVANMPERFREHYPDSALVGFGSIFHRDAPGAAFSRYWEHLGPRAVTDEMVTLFQRECDGVFTALAPPRVLVDVEYVDREFASDPDRLWKQPDHGKHRKLALDLARASRGGR